jgi:hypothetical protein
MAAHYYLTNEDLRASLGMVVPIWFPPALAVEEVEAILATSLADVETCVDLRHLVAVVDAAPQARAAAERLQARYQARHGKTFVVLPLPENRGKGGAVAAGLHYLLDSTRVEAVVVRDADGDHFVNDVPHLARLGRQMVAEQGTDLIVVNGGRRELHRPLGWVRGQYELFVNDIVWHGLAYARARAGGVIPQQYLNYGGVPDLQSGFKLYTRASVARLAEASDMVGRTSPDMLRWGCEVLPVVELLLAGGIIGEINRITLHTQPLTTYNGASRQRIYGSILTWTLRRLEISAASAQQLFDNALARALFASHAGFHAELLDLRRDVLANLGGSADTDPTVAAFC